MLWELLVLLAISDSLVFTIQKIMDVETWCSIQNPRQKKADLLVSIINIKRKRANSSIIIGLKLIQLRQNN